MKIERTVKKMWSSILNILIYAISGILFWMVVFFLLFTLSLFIIGKIALKHETKTQKENFFLQNDFSETTEFFDQISVILHLLSKEDERLCQAIEMLTLESKISYAQKWLPEICMEASDDFDGWSLMIFTLDKFGYLSYNDWKFTMEDIICNLESNLKNYKINPNIFDGYSNKERIIDPVEFPRLASYLPEDYALASIDTGGDSYALTVAPITNVEKAINIAESMKKPPFVKGIEIIKK